MERMMVQFKPLGSIITLASVFLRLIFLCLEPRHPKTQVFYVITAPIKNSVYGVASTINIDANFFYNLLFILTIM